MQVKWIWWQSLLTVLVFHLCRHAVLHRLTQEVGCRGMFSTHYHRLATDHASDPTVRFFFLQICTVHCCECSLKIIRDRESNNAWESWWVVTTLEDAELCRVLHGWLFCLLMNNRLVWCRWRCVIWAVKLAALKGALKKWRSCTHCHLVLAQRATVSMWPASQACQNLFCEGLVHAQQNLSTCLSIAMALRMSQLMHQTHRFVSSSKTWEVYCKNQGLTAIHFCHYGKKQHALLLFQHVKVQGACSGNYFQKQQQQRLLPLPGGSGHSFFSDDGLSILGSRLGAFLKLSNLVLLNECPNCST